jgi:hypothetical protein
MAWADEAVVESPNPVVTMTMVEKPTLALALVVVFLARLPLESSFR